jgi:hypothetical protein
VGSLGGGANASARSTGSGQAQATASAVGGAGSGNAGGTATANASARSTGSAQTQATAYAVGGAGSIQRALGGSASTSSSAQNSYGTALTSASAPGAGEASALANASVGPGPEAPINIIAGRAVSNAILTPKSSTIAVGAMAAAYGGPGFGTPTLQYTTTAFFDFSASSKTLYLNLLSDNFSEFSGIAFDSLELQVSVNGVTHTPYILASLTGAEHFFTNDPLLAIAAGSRSVSLTYDLTYNPGTSAVVGDGFGFTYDLATAPVAKALTTTAFGFTAAPTATIPEPGLA